MSLLRSDARPLYVRAAERLRGYIEDNKLADGDRLPTEAGLAELLGVSRSTIREGLRDLELRGMVERVHGRGTIVRTPTVVTGLNALESLEALAARQSWQCGTVGTTIEEGPIPEGAARALGVEPGTAGVRLARVKTRDGKPMCEMVSWLSASMLSADTLRASFETSITELLVRSPVAHLVSARAEVSAAPATDDEAAKLGLTRGDPLVVLFETFLDEAERPTCWSRNAFVPDAITLAVTRRPVGA
jgi:DNA-binding GntR family transcriptional regulator